MPAGTAERRVPVDVEGMEEPISVTAISSAALDEGVTDTASHREEAWSRIPRSVDQLASEVRAGRCITPTWIMWESRGLYRDGYVAAKVTGQLLSGELVEVPDHIARVLFGFPANVQSILLWRAVLPAPLNSSCIKAAVADLQQGEGGPVYIRFPERLRKRCVEGQWLVMTPRGASNRQSVRVFSAGSMEKVVRRFNAGRPWPAQLLPLDQKRQQQRQQEEEEGEGEQDEDEEEDEKEDEEQEAVAQAAPPAWSGLDPAGKAFDRPSARTVWLSGAAAPGNGMDEGEEDGAVDFAALCCTGSVLREGGSTIPKDLGSRLLGVDGTNIATHQVDVVASSDVGADGRPLAGATTHDLRFRRIHQGSKWSLKVTGLGAVFVAANGGRKPPEASWLALARLGASSFAAHVYLPGSEEAAVLGSHFTKGTPAERPTKRRRGGVADQDVEQQERARQQALQQALDAAGEREEESDGEDSGWGVEEDGEGGGEVDQLGLYVSASSTLAGAGAGGDADSDAEGPEAAAAAAEALGMLGADVGRMPEPQPAPRGRLAKEAAALAKQRAASEARRQADVNQRDARAMRRRHASPEPAADAAEPPKKRKRGRLPKAAAVQAVAEPGHSQQHQRQPPSKQLGARPAAGRAQPAAVPARSAARGKEQQEPAEAELADAGGSGGIAAVPAARAPRGQRQQQQQVPPATVPPLQPQAEQPQAEQLQAEQPAAPLAQQAEQLQQVQAAVPAAAGGQPDVEVAAQAMRVSLRQVASYLQAQADSGALQAGVAEAAQACGLLGGGPLGPAGAAQLQQDGVSDEDELAAPLPAGLLRLLDDVLGHRPKLMRAVGAWMQREGIRTFGDLGYANAREMRAALPRLTTTLYNKLWDEWELRGGFDADDA